MHLSRQASLEAALEQAKDIEDAAEGHDEDQKFVTTSTQSHLARHTPDLDAAEQLEAYPKLLEDGKTYVFKGGSTWCGDPLKDSQPNGQGVFTTKRGCAFRTWLGPAPNGFFKDGQLNGYGNITKPNGYAYTGQCWRNQPHGTGLMRNDVEGYDHDGSFYAGMANGPGIEKTRELGTIVTTETVWGMGQKNGLGKVTEHFSQGGKSRVRTRTGEFVKNKREGPWVETTKENDHLVVDWQGEYKDGFKHGPFKQVVYESYGERTETVGSNKHGMYEGRVDIRTYKGGVGCTGGLSCNYYVHGRKNGEGVIDLGDGRKLIGPFCNDKEHGWFRAEQPGAPDEWRWYENGEENRDKTKRRKRREERAAQGKQKRLKGCPGCTSNSQKHCMRNFECERTHGGPGSNTDSASDAELTDINE